MMPSRPISYILILALSKFATGQQQDPPTCPCFKASQLERFTTENIDKRTSCRSDGKKSIGIFLQPEPPSENGQFRGFHGPYGFQVMLHDNESSCLMEGDMMFMIDTVEEAEVCSQMIRNRCADIGHTAVEL